MPLLTLAYIAGSLGAAQPHRTSCKKHSLRRGLKRARIFAIRHRSWFRRLTILRHSYPCRPGHLGLVRQKSRVRRSDKKFCQIRNTIRFVAHQLTTTPTPHRAPSGLVDTARLAQNAAFAMTALLQSTYPRLWTSRTMFAADTCAGQCRNGELCKYRHPAATGLADAAPKTEPPAILPEVVRPVSPDIISLLRSLI